MKRILLILLLASPALAQVYSQMAIQNTQGNWLKASPGALVYLCTAGTSNNNCLAGIGTVALFTDQNLNTSQTNPIVADANGNYTIFTVSGIYQQCVKAVTSFCQLIQVGGGSNGVPLLFRTNSPNCTTLSQLVTYDTVHLDANSVATVQNAAAGGRNVIGVVVAGAGCSGIATIGTYLSALVTMDGAAVVGNVVSPSGSVAGFAADEGATTSQPNVQTVGRISKANTGGAGTTAQVDFFLGDIQSPGSSSGSGTVTNCASASGANAFYPGVGTVVSCDPLVTDSNGVLTMNGANFVDNTFGGYFRQQQGPAPSLSAPNSVYVFPPTSVGTTYGLSWPGALPTNNDCLKFSVVGVIAQLVDSGAPCGTGSGTTLQTNTVNNSSQVLLDFHSTPTITPSNTSGGIEQFDLAGSGQISTPTAPTLTPASPGSTAYSYKVVACEDSGCAAHTPASSATATATGNANLATGPITLSVYGDTLYGPRCFDIYRTASAGTPNSTGLIAHCVGKIFKDNGLAGDSSTAPTTNTTTLQQVCLASASPGVASPPGQPCGVDAPPASPTVSNVEAQNSFGLPGDANDGVWTWVNQGSTTAAWSNGELLLTSISEGSGAYRFIGEAIPPGSTPWTYVAYIYPMLLFANAQCGLSAEESATGKMTSFVLQQNQILGGGSVGGIIWAVDRWSNATTRANVSFLEDQSAGGLYMKLRDDGTNLVFSYSYDGIGYQVFNSQLVSAAFTTAPNRIGFSIDANAATSGGNACDLDYIRKTE